MSNRPLTIRYVSAPYHAMNKKKKFLGHRQKSSLTGIVNVFAAHPSLLGSAFDLFLHSYRTPASQLRSLSHHPAPFSPPALSSSFLSSCHFVPTRCTHSLDQSHSRSLYYYLGSSLLFLIDIIITILPAFLPSLSLISLITIINPHHYHKIHPPPIALHLLPSSSYKQDLPSS
ncbi:hypothetical protein P167DRAFT_431680 [Morchella conica CCBAS932]|uniref:Uncharacterized protein n=1 Tax=Morchella conica CCBAS932 TaxID=1392247 RepID=A0A3N4KY32_9PEZI|nr:hypothetical protein P167DRAFT_431680 [Morchella conica CCBAS932]